MLIRAMLSAGAANGPTPEQDLSAPNSLHRIELFCGAQRFCDASPRSTPEHERGWIQQQTHARQEHSPREQAHRQEAAVDVKNAGCHSLEYSDRTRSGCVGTEVHWIGLDRKAFVVPITDVASFINPVHRATGHRPGNRHTDIPSWHRPTKCGWSAIALARPARQG